jgi:hypothetical protein
MTDEGMRQRAARKAVDRTLSSTKDVYQGVYLLDITGRECHF